jgi:hypothetical protein
MKRDVMVSCQGGRLGEVMQYDPPVRAKNSVSSTGAATGAGTFIGDECHEGSGESKAAAANRTTANEATT